MCLAALSIGQSARFPFVLASNRDEFFGRATESLAWWQPADGTPPVLSGRDLAGGGTWLGLNAAGRLALVTNVREPGRHLVASPSRGDLVLHWFGALADSRPALEVELPQTGVTTERERQLSSAFVHIAGDDGDGRAYGTRCSTVVVVEAPQGRRSVHVVERTHDVSGRATGMRAARFLLSPGE
ncbi:hypothetical protein BH11PSE8_BH11PSE8_19100 [soil metagenome]